MQQLNEQDLVYILPAIEWTPEKLKEVRMSLKIGRKEIADIFGVSVTTILSMETNKVKNPMALVGYGLVLERIMALRKDYIPAFRKIGESDFMKGDPLDDCVE